MSSATMLLMLRVTALCLLGYFGTANSLVKATEMFTFYIPFSRKMAEGGVYSRDDHRRLLTGRWVPLLVIFAVSTGLGVWLSVNAFPVGPVAGICSVLAGLLVFCRALRDKKLTMQKFVVQYRAFMDKEKFRLVLQDSYGMTLEELSGYKRV